MAWNTCAGKCQLSSYRGSFRNFIFLAVFFLFPSFQPTAPCLAPSCWCFVNVPMEIQDDERSTEGAKNSANSESLEDEETLIAPLVFQCGRCRCIVGDSFSFVCTDQSLGLVCLSGCPPPSSIHSICALISIRGSPSAHSCILCLAHSGDGGGAFTASGALHIRRRRRLVHPLPLLPPTRSVCTWLANFLFRAPFNGQCVQRFGVHHVWGLQARQALHSHAQAARAHAVRVSLPCATSSPHALHCGSPRIFVCHCYCRQLYSLNTASITRCVTLHTLPLPRRHVPFSCTLKRSPGLQLHVGFRGTAG